MKNSVEHDRHLDRGETAPVIARRIVNRTRGRTHGPITRLVSPSDLGQLIKPFVFLDFFDVHPERPANFGLHPHSGIATLTFLVDGSVRFHNSRGEPAALQAGEIEWMRAGQGVWHGGPMVHESRVQGYQLWVALPPALELSDSYECFLSRKDIPEVGPARVLLGHFAGRQSPIDDPAPMTYLHIRLSDGERWRFEPPSGHDVLWVAVHKGSLTTEAESIPEGELAVFERDEQGVELVAAGDCAFVLGSAARSPHELVLGYYSVHTSASALQQGEAHIEELGAQLKEQGRLRR